MKILDKMQRRATIWIFGAFKMLPLEGIEAITGIIPIKFHLQKLARRSQICPFKLPTNHILRELMLRLMPSGVNMDMGKGYDNNDQLRWSSLSQRLMW